MYLRCTIIRPRHALMGYWIIRSLCMPSDSSPVIDTKWYKANLQQPLEILQKYYQKIINTLVVCMWLNHHTTQLVHISTHYTYKEFKSSLPLSSHKNLLQTGLIKNKWILQHTNMNGLFVTQTKWKLTRTF